MRFAWCGHTCIAADQVQQTAGMPLQPPVCALLPDAFSDSSFSMI